MPTVSSHSLYERNEDSVNRTIDTFVARLRHKIATGGGGTNGIMTRPIG